MNSTPFEASGFIISFINDLWWPIGFIINRFFIYDPVNDWRSELKPKDHVVYNRKLPQTYVRETVKPLKIQGCLGFLYK